MQDVSDPNTKPSATRLGPRYWRLWTASVISNFGDGLSVVAYPWLTSAVTRSPVAIAGIGIVRFLPWLVFTLPAGVITDRYDRRKLVATMDSIRFVVTLAVALAILPIQSNLATPEEVAAGTAGPPAQATAILVVLYLSALLFGLAEVLRDNSAQTLLPSIVDKNQLERANGRMWSAEMVMNTFIGPPLAGPLLAVAFVLPFFIDAASFAVAAGLVFTITGKAFQPPPAAERRTIREDLREGFRWLWDHLFFRRLAIALGLTNGLGMMATATFVLFAQEILRLDAFGFGLLGTGFAIGGVVGGIGGAKVSEKLGPGTAILGTLWVMAVTLALTGLTSSGRLVWAFGIIQGFSSTLWNVVTVSLRQQVIPDRLLGRVNSVYRFFGWGSMPIGTALGGIIADQVEIGVSRSVGLRTPFVLAGIGHVLLALWAWPRINTRTISEVRATVDDDQPEIAAGSDSD
jgi:MFS family permease